MEQSVLDREKLAKVLALTQSSHEGEVLSAVRKANATIAKEGLTWGEVLANHQGHNLHVTINRGFAAPEFYEAVEAWRVRTKR